MSGGKKDRPQLDELLKQLRAGDKVVVYKLDRISRSTKHLIELSDMFADQEVDFVSIQDQIDTSTAMGRFFFRTMASIAELEKGYYQRQNKSRIGECKSKRSSRWQTKSG